MVIWYIFFRFVYKTNLIHSLKYFYDGYKFGKSEENIKHLETSTNSNQNYSKITGKIINTPNLLHLAANRSVKQYKDAVYLETRVEEFYEDWNGNVQGKTNGHIYNSLTPQFTIQLPNNDQCLVYTQGVNPYFLSSMAHPVSFTPIMTEKKELVGSALDPPSQKTVINAGSENVYGIGTGENVTVYGHIKPYGKLLSIQKPVCDFCPFLITKGDSNEVLNYYEDAQLNSYYTGLCFLAVGGICLYFKNKHKNNYV